MNGQEGYSDISQLTDPYTWKYFPRIIQKHKIYTMLALMEGSVSILDVGCGIGTITKKIKERYPGTRVVGIDTNAEAIKSGRLLFTDLDLQNRDLMDITEKFDTISLFDTLEHIDDLWEFMKKCSTIATRNIIFTVPNGFSIIHPSYQIFDKERLMNICSHIGKTYIFPGLNQEWFIKSHILSTLSGIFLYLLNLDDEAIKYFNAKADMQRCQNYIVCISVR